MHTGKKSLPNKLKKEFGNSVTVDIINVDEKNNDKKYEDLINSINNFSDEHRNKFPLIKIDNLFTIIGYDYYYDNEIINDIIRINKGHHLGKSLEKSRYIERN